MAHMDRISMGDMHGVRMQYDYKRARAPDLVLPPRETPRRYMRQWLKKSCCHIYCLVGFEPSYDLSLPYELG